MLNRLIRFLVLAVVRLFYGQVEVRGREHLPASGPIIFILNHPNGLVDALLLLAVVDRRVALLGKSTFFEHPFWRWFMPAFDVLPVYRQRDKGLAGGPAGNLYEGNAATFARCRALLQQGGALALFPEGTTHSHPGLLPLKSGAARLALDAEASGDWQRGSRSCRSVCGTRIKRALGRRRGW
jgi:1-acyl-sn-glycerol-3-phosphate acyltransferase